jgi:hypothetical protein
MLMITVLVSLKVFSGEVDYVDSFVLCPIV